MTAHASLNSTDTATYSNSTRHVVIVSFANSKPMSQFFRWGTMPNRKETTAISPLSGNVTLTEDWALCVFDTLPNANRISSRTIRTGSFFDFPLTQLDLPPSATTHRLPRDMLKRATAIHYVGTTTYSDAAIDRLQAELSHAWGTEYKLLWNCQYFAVLLGGLLVAPRTPRSCRGLRRLLEQLHSAHWDWCCRRHILCMGVMGVGGVLTGGALLPVAAWLTAGGSMVSADLKQSWRGERFAQICETWPCLRVL